MKILTYTPYPILKHGVLNILQQNPTYSIKDYATGKVQFCNLDENYTPDVVFLSFLDEKEQFIIDFCQQAMVLYPKASLVLFCPTVSIATAKKFFKTGILGVLQHNASEAELLQAIDSVAKGVLFLDATLTEKLKIIQLKSSAKTDHCSCLTIREKQVLNLIVEEYTTKEIAKELFVSDCTIETHRLNLISKLGVKNTAGLVREACINQIYQPSLMC
jgi:DNA-binding NarL/FixJ family response regulator